jgi:prepilin-type processing-associated H-X9-DG protein
VWICPSDPLGDFPGTNFRVCFGTSPGIHEERTVPAARGAYHGAFSFSGRRLAEIVDGISHTSFVAEKAQGDRDTGRYTPWRDTAILTGIPTLLPEEAAAGCATVTSNVGQHYSYGGSAWLFSDCSQTWYNHVLTPNSVIPDCSTYHSPSYLGAGAHTARSLHSGGVHVLMGDGAVRFVADGVDLMVWRASATVDGEDANDAW